MEGRRKVGKRKEQEGIRREKDRRGGERRCKERRKEEPRENCFKKMRKPTGFMLEVKSNQEMESWREWRFWWLEKWIVGGVEGVWWSGDWVNDV